MEDVKKLIEALEERKKELGGIGALAKDINIPKTTLGPWLSGRKGKERRLPSKKYIPLIVQYLEKTAPLAKKPEEVKKKVAKKEIAEEEVLKEAEERTEKIKHLLILVHYELKWFIEAPKEARDIFRKNIELSDVGYLGSLLTMLGKEDFFKRWKMFTTETFSKFNKRKRK